MSEKSNFYLAFSTSNYRSEIIAAIIGLIFAAIIFFAGEILLFLLDAVIHTFGRIAYRNIGIIHCIYILIGLS